MTIAIPFYRGREYLRCAIESVLKQSDPRWDLVISDDGQDPEILNQVVQYSDSRVRYSRNQSNLGMAGNWNRCLDLAQTDLVSILHHDDELEPDYVSLMLTSSRRFPDAAGLFCNAKIIDHLGNDLFSLVDYLKRFLRPECRDAFELHGESGVASLMGGNYIICPTMCYRRSRLPVEWFRSKWKMVLDLELFTRILFGGGGLVGLPNEAYRYRRHSENATSEYTRTLLRFHEESQLHDEIAAVATNRGWSLAAKRAAAKMPIKLHLAYLSILEFASFDFCSGLRKIRFLFHLLFGTKPFA